MGGVIVSLAPLIRVPVFAKGEMKYELSPRYYIAEASAWLLGATLLASRFVGLELSQPVPLLNLTFATQQHSARVVAALLTLATLYLVFEWKQSDLKARFSYWAKTRISFTVIFICVSLWFSYPLVAVNTRFEGISPAWYLGFFLIGFVLGELISLLAFTSLMIRTPIESRTLRLPRIPVATRAQYQTWIPVTALLLIVYYVLFYFSPDAIKDLGPFLVGVPFLFMVGRGHASLFLGHDSNGRRIPYAKRIARFKEIHDSHDYSYFLIDCGEKMVGDLDVDVKAAPQLIQETIQKKFTANPSAEAVNFTVQTLDKFQFQFYSKDGDTENQAFENLGVRIQKDKGNGNYIKVLVVLKDVEREPIEINVLTKVVEKYAEEYFSAHQDHDSLRSSEFVSYAINQAVIQHMVEQAGPPLHRAVETGDEKQVAELLKQDIDVNERAEYGWTALLYASAQGYPKILRLLLDAGANPDIGNVHGVTSLMFGARYGNSDVCKILIEYGANTDLQDTYGMTALIAATKIGSADVVELLLRAGANRTIKDCNRMAALDYAYKGKQGNIAKCLRRK